MKVQIEIKEGEPGPRIDLHLVSSESSVIGWPNLSTMTSDRALHTRGEAGLPTSCQAA